jgi:hypothetical protein
MATYDENEMATLIDVVVSLLFTCDDPKIALGLFMQQLGAVFSEAWLANNSEGTRAA